MESGFAPREEVRTQVARKKRISGREFLAAFRKRPDDYFLMIKFSLSPRQLRRVYEALISKERLAEYEFHARAIKAPEVDHPTLVPSGLTTVVSVVECAAPPPADSTPVSCEPADGPAAGQNLLAMIYTRQTWATEHARTVPPSEDSTGLRALVPVACPKCWKPVEAFSPESCAYCGIVFDKIKDDPRYKGVFFLDLPPLRGQGAG